MLSIITFEATHTELHESLTVVHEELITVKFFSSANHKILQTSKSHQWKFSIYDNMNLAMHLQFQINFSFHTL